MGCCSSKKPPPIAVPARQTQARTARFQPSAPVSNAALPPRYESTYSEPRHQTPAYVRPDLEDDEEFLTLICEVKLPAERNACNITDTVELPDGSLVLCDQRNGKLLLLNEDFRFVNGLSLGGLPYKITDIPWRRGTLAVTVLTGNKIQYVKVNTGILQAEEIALQTAVRCRGIDCAKDMLIYIMDKHVTMQDKENNSVEMEHDFMAPVSILVDRKHEYAYILCETNECCARLIKAKLHENTREFDSVYPEIRGPVSLCADQRGLIYICGRDPPSIYKVSDKGDNLGNVFQERFGLLQHLQYSRANDVFVVTKPNTNKLWLYRFE